MAAGTIPATRKLTTAVEELARCDSMLKERLSDTRWIFGTQAVTVVEVSVYT
jgi:hypothetical protein